MKKLNKLSLSLVVGSLLFTQSYALPSGGKFTHGTSGSISVSGGTMNISGSKTNSVIQWGGGFNIANGETVNFKGSGKNYLNIAYGTKSSTIDGLLNATGNNVYLINPNGVVIGKSGTINANKFGVSTSSIDSKAMQEFADRSTFESPVFSPKFTANKGNVINMGNIKANDVLIIGNEVSNDNDIAKNQNAINNKNNGRIEADKIQFVGNKVKVNADNIKTDDLLVSAKDQAIVTQSTTGVYQNEVAIIDTALRTTANQNGDYKVNFTTIDKSNTDKFTALTTISSLEDWAYFAKGINEGKTGMHSIDTFDLVNDLDFGANCNSKGVCTGQNYANFNVAGNSELQGVNMIVGTTYDNIFRANFNGNGHTLSNINIDITVNDDYRAGLFGNVGGIDFANSNKYEIKDLIVDYKGGGIKLSYFFNDTYTSLYVGGFVGNALYTVNFSNISLVNLGNIIVNSINNDPQNSNIYIGGFAGWTSDVNFNNIYINNIKNISTNTKESVSVGGFAGRASRGNFNNISLNNIENISSYSKSPFNIGGFAGVIDANANFINIKLNNFKNMQGKSTNTGIDEIHNYIGGFAGYYFGISNPDERGVFSDIILNNIGNISSDDYAGGFLAGVDHTASQTNWIGILKAYNIYMFFDENTKIAGKGSSSLFSDLWEYDDLKNVHIYYKKGTSSDATADSKYWNTASGFDDAGKDGFVNIHTYNDSSKDEAYQAFLKKAGDITITPPETPSINPDDLDFTIEQTNNKISQDDIDKDVIDSILADANVDSWINVNDNPMNVHIDSNDINALNQSFDFMEALGSDFTNTYLQNKGATEIKNILQAKTNIQALIGNVNNLVNNYNDFQNTKEDLDKAIDAYNAYVALINQGAASSKDAEFTSLKNKVNELYAKAQGYLDTYKFDDTLKSYKTQALSQSNNHFSIKGEFDTKPASLDSVLDKPNNEGGDTSNPEINAPLPFSEALLTQMDKSVLKQDEDDKQASIDEASTQESGNACIVSDNFKAGNPCSR
ncbi:filamentous hemagglutinin N-terminal domain-containing protein [Campylobacter jejuni]|nr:filamentous hemagglutinin N-terminal domain-containing protein [Campylobacter jejuni]